MHIITNGGIAVDPSKVQDVLNWSPPKNVPEIRSFLGLAGYYRRFIEGFSKIVKPLTTLLEKGKEFKWDEKCQDNFEELKKRLTTSHVLIMPDIHKGFDVYCDASRQGLGCVLMQEGKCLSSLLLAVNLYRSCVGLGWLAQETTRFILFGPLMSNTLRPVRCCHVPELGVLVVGVTSSSGEGVEPRSRETMFDPMKV
jgi:hypothetical protein